jgi:ankyrin repeat protein
VCQLDWSRASHNLFFIAGALVNAHHHHQTALHIAAANKNEAFVQLLIQFGADFFAENSRGLRPRQLIPPEDSLHKLLLEFESMDL